MLGEACGADRAGSGKPVVMVADDDTDFVDITRTLLESNGYRVVAAYSGHGALSLVEETHPRLIILDIMMETWSEGLSVAARLRSLPQTRDTPIVVVSSLDLCSPLSNAVPVEDCLHADAYMVKPVPPWKLLHTVGELIAAAHRHAATE